MAKLPVPIEALEQAIHSALGSVMIEVAPVLALHHPPEEYREILPRSLSNLHHTRRITALLKDFMMISIILRSSAERYGMSILDRELRSLRFHEPEYASEPLKLNTACNKIIHAISGYPVSRRYSEFKISKSTGFFAQHLKEYDLFLIFEGYRYRHKWSVELGAIEFLDSAAHVLAVLKGYDERQGQAANETSPSPDGPID